MYYSYYYFRIVPFIINPIQFLSKPSPRRSTDSMRMRKVTSCLLPIIDCGIQLMLGRSDHYSMFTEWRHDIRYKTTLSCLDCVECAGWWLESEMKVSGLHAE